MRSVFVYIVKEIILKNKQRRWISSILHVLILGVRSDIISEAIFLKWHRQSCFD